MWDVKPMEELLGMKNEEMLDPLEGAMELAVSMDELGMFERVTAAKKSDGSEREIWRGNKVKIFMLSALQYVVKLVRG